MDTTWKKGTKRLKRRRKKVMRITYCIGESPNGLNLARSSSVLSPEGKYQVGNEKEKSARRRTVPRSSTISPNDPEHEDAEGES
ncbi:hypothetical protein H5410_003979 [Solanum commersonii]|uniref:Uncharacterized protein n=1 Tax=Solanum commersonii TaxID=4109 RepID=A0A9J6B6C3_SOLCO|nr:hypothetical protein H5410_003979 [Solanum commersonii]